MEETIFAKIIRREVPAEIVYEDAETIAFLDHGPDSPGHTLVVPKKSFKNVFDMDDATLANVMQTAKKVAEALRTSLGAEGVNIIMNNEPAAGQIVFHAHVHVIPRHQNDGLSYAEKGKPYRKGEAALIAAKLCSALG